MPKRKKHASDTRGGEGAAGGSLAERAGAGGSSTDQPLAPKLPTDKELSEAYAMAMANGSNPHRGSTFDANDFIPDKTPDKVSGLPAATTPSVALATAEQEDAFCQAVVDHLGIKPACQALGLRSAAVFYWGNTRPVFRDKLNAALAATREELNDRFEEDMRKLLSMPPKEMNQCANAYRVVGEQHIRMLGKLNARTYGDRPGTQVNIQNNTGIVCTEEQREKLIQMNQKLLTARTTTNQEQLPER